MKITDVKTVLLTGPCTNDPFLSETRKLRSAAFVEIHTDTEHLGLERPTQAIFRRSPFDSAEEFFSINLVAAERSEAALWVLGTNEPIVFPYSNEARILISPSTKARS